MEHEKTVRMVGAAAAAVARAALPSPAGVISEIAAAWLRAAGGTGTDRFAEAVKLEIEEAVLCQFPELARRVAKLEQEGVPVNTADVAHVGEHFARSWAHAADGKKRALLEDAFLRSFDRSLYESGLLNVLWGCLDRLSYGDLVLLRKVVVPDDRQGAAVHEPEPGTLDSFHAGRLQQEGLVQIVPFTRQPRPHDPNVLRVTDLGRRLYQLALVDGT